MLEANNSEVSVSARLYYLLLNPFIAKPAFCEEYSPEEKVRAHRYVNRGGAEFEREGEHKCQADSYKPHCAGGDNHDITGVPGCF